MPSISSCLGHVFPSARRPMIYKCHWLRAECIILPKMPTAPVDTNVKLLTDSGPVASSTNYTTLVIYHGTAFNGNSLLRLVPFAAPDDIHLVIVNGSRYAGSTKYTDAEMQELRGDRKTFMESTGRQVANFLLWFVETNKIPQISPDRKGGVGLLVMPPPSLSQDTQRRCQRIRTRSWKPTFGD